MHVKAARSIERRSHIIPLCDGSRTSAEIAELLGESQKYIQQTMLELNLPRRAQGAGLGVNNPAFVSGRRIDRDGYVMTSAPLNHPHARTRHDRNYGLMLEHRLVMESVLNRYLDPLEVVDHIDGLRLHNRPDNLRLFESNAEHLKTTITGQVPRWSEEGRLALKKRRASGDQCVNKYREMKKSGDARLRQILLAALKLGVDSPYLLGTRHHITKAGISDLSHSSLERALADLYQRYA